MSAYGQSVKNYQAQLAKEARERREIEVARQQAAAARRRGESVVVPPVKKVAPPAPPVVAAPVSAPVVAPVSAPVVARAPAPVAPKVNALRSSGAYAKPTGPRCYIELSDDEIKAIEAAISKGDLEELKNIWKEGMDVDVRTQGGWTPLMYACQKANKGTYDIVSFLLEKGANADLYTSNGLTALHLAAVNGGEPVFQGVYKYNNAETVKLLLKSPTTNVLAKDCRGLTAKMRLEQSMEGNYASIQKNDPRAIEILKLLSEYENVSNRNQRAGSRKSYSKKTRRVRKH